MDEPDDLEEIFRIIEADNRRKLVTRLNRSPELVQLATAYGEPQTLLHYAAWQGAEKIARELLKRGADVNALGSFTGGIASWTPLHYAVYHSQPKMVRLLLANGADPNLRDEDQYTPLHLAALRVGPERPEMAEALLGAGATLALQAAILLDRTDDARRLLRDDPELIRTAANAADLLSNAVCSRDLTLVRLVVEAGADPNAVGRGQHCLVCALSFVSRPEQTPMINYLLDCGADPDFRRAAGSWTARETAAKNGDKKALALFNRTR